MANFKLTEDLFLGVQELQTLTSFIKEQGYLKLFLQNVESFGIVQNSSLFLNSVVGDASSNFRITQSATTGFLDIDSGVAIDSSGNLIIQDSKAAVLEVPQDSAWYWIRIKHKTSPIEMGTVSIDTTGQLTGSGTRFTEVLRGGDTSVSSRVTFSNEDGSPVNNIGDFEVVDILSDTQAILQGVFSNETNLQYAVTGTFTPGVTPTSNSKFPFQYDSCELTLVPEVVNGLPPYQPTDNLNQSFFIYRVRNINGTISIEDKRERSENGFRQIFQTKPSFDLKNFINQKLPIVGVETVKFGERNTPKVENKVQVGWGFRSTSFTVDSNASSITLNNGSGGKFASTGDFTNGDFNGYRLYVVPPTVDGNDPFNSVTNNTVYRITNSVINSTSIVLTLEYLNPTDFVLGSSVVIVPEADGIEILAEPILLASTIPATQARKLFEFNIAQGFGVLDLPVYDAAVDYKISYRLKSFKTYGNFVDIGDGTYFGEDSFDANGNIIIPSIPKSYTDGNLQLVRASDSYQNIINQVFRGDSVGVDIINVPLIVNSTNNVVNLEVGVTNTNVILSSPGTVTFDSEYIINLPISGVQEGNEFYIQFNFNRTTSPANNIIIKYGANTDGSGGTNVFEPITTFLYEAARKSSAPTNDPGWLAVRVVYDATTNSWRGTYVTPFLWQRTNDRLNTLESQVQSSWQTHSLNSSAGGDFNLNGVENDFNVTARYKVVGNICYYNFRFSNIDDGVPNPSDANRNLIVWPVPAGLIVPNGTFFTALGIGPYPIPTGLNGSTAFPAFGEVSGTTIGVEFGDILPANEPLEIRGNFFFEIQ